MLATSTAAAIAAVRARALKSEAASVPEAADAPRTCFAPAVNRRELLRRAGGGAIAVAALGGSGFGLARAAAALEDPRVRRFRSRPDLRPPAPWVTGSESGSPGRVFYTPMGGPGQTGLLIVDERGEPVWFEPSPKGLARLDFRVQEYRGKPVLTWWEGQVGKGYGNGHYVLRDETYAEVARVEARDGQKGDLHDFQLTPEGTALFTCYRKDGKVVEGVIQEVDVESGRLLFEWHSLDHVPVSDSYRTAASFGKDGFDYIHVNSVAVAPDGDLIVSGRHTWTVYKLDRRSGEVRWRLGGKHGDFALGRGARFAYQHDARPHPDGTMTIFDNGSEPAVEPRSRALRLALDTRAMRADVVWAWTHPRSLLGGAMGNVQLLSDGGAFVGWGAAGGASEFRPDGFVRWDASFPKGAISYRSYRSPWTGSPKEKPRAVRSGGTVYASWNGATEVAAWEARRGGQVVGRARSGGFETAIRVGGASGSLTVAALAADGSTLASVAV
jgi:hypothetical protein